jgi:uncharacterized protein (UPF0264 family)
MNFAAPHFDSPRLLVSVRNADEAEAALAGGCDILDVKEPALGAMGMAALATIAATVSRVRELTSSVPVSVALGETAEWRQERPSPSLPTQIGYLKMGTAGLQRDVRWERRLAEVKERFVDGGCGPAKWIAVAYADWNVARGPCPGEIVDRACECGYAGVLIDTFSKTDRRLFHWLRIEQVESLATVARSYGLEFALAGRLQIDDIPRIGLVNPDIVGIRSAACRQGIRTGEIDAAEVRGFRAALQSATSRLVPPVMSPHDVNQTEELMTEK